MTFFAPAADDTTKVLAAEKLPADWMAFDSNKRPLGTAAEVAAVMRGDLSARLARQFDAQGIASVTVPSAVTRNRLVVTMLASGSADPDVIEIDLDPVDAAAQAVGRVDLRSRLQAPGDPLLDSVMRLNLAVALVRVGMWSAARLELQRVKLNDGPGVAADTIHYLLGLTAERLGNLAEAEAAFKIAASSTALETEDGLPVKDLAEARLKGLQRRPGQHHD